MKKIIFTCLLIFYSHLSYSQWVQLNSGTFNSFYDVSFINSRTGWVNGDNPIILKTENGGKNWIQQYNVNTSDMHLDCIYFVDYNNGFAGGDSLQNPVILKTTNNGLNWNLTRLNTNYGGIRDIYFSNQNTGWAGGFNNIGGIDRGVIFYTTNGGTNWNVQFTTSSPYPYIKQMVFANSNLGWAISNALGWGLIYKTTNGGQNWNQIGTSYNNISFNAISMLDINTGWIGGTNNTLWKTTNGGDNWISQIITGQTVYSLGFISQNTGFAGCFNNLFKTTNGGNNWNIDSSQTFYLINSIQFPNAYTGYAVGGSGRIFKNTLFKANLNDIYLNIGRVMNTNIVLSDSLCVGTIDSVYWYVNDSLVSRLHSTVYNFKQGTKFVKLVIKNNAGEIDTVKRRVNVGIYKKYTNGQILAGESMIGDSIFYSVSTGNAVYRMDINGNFIYPLVTGGSILSECSISYDTNVYITSTDANLYGFKNDGSNIWPPIPLGGQASTTPTIDSASNRLYIGVSNGYFRAINRINGTSAFSYFCDAPVKSSAVLSSSRKLVVASAVGTVYGFNLNLPSPSPPSWTLALNDSILVSPAIDSLGYFYFGSRSGKIYKVALIGTTNASVVWQQTLGSPVTSSPVIDANSNLYAGTASGKLYSLKISNGNINWNFQTDSAIRSTPAITPYGRIYFGNDKGEVFGIDTNKNINFYFIDSAKVSCSMLYGKGTLYFGNETGRLFAFYDTTAGLEKTGRGVPIWGTFQNNVRRTGSQRDGNTIGIKQISDIVPDKFELYQNYPNPFNPSTIIKFNIPLSSKHAFGGALVKLKIYDILGREIITLVNEKLQPGVYGVQFSNNQLASGVYFYKLTAGEFTEIKKMILMK